MANAYTALYTHYVFSTKNRKPIITPDIENRIWSYIGGIVRNHDSSAIQVGGIEDHIHALIRSPPKYAPSQIAQFMKGDSSKWIHEEFDFLSKFAWQDGYGAFSVNKSSVPRVIEYIQNQRQKHEVLTFEDEYKELLTLHEIDIVDEKYLFG